MGQKEIDAATKALSRAMAQPSGGDEWSADLPEAPEIPKKADETVAVGYKTAKRKGGSA